MKAAAGSRYEENVFVNCPFDETYRSLFEAIVFCIYACGFRARCALELDDSAPVRIEKICRIIGECQHGVHDVSRVQLDAATTLPRFNMPFELGLFLGARQYGHGKQRHKRCLILDSEPYRYRSFLSDIAGQDIKSHSDHPQKAVRLTRDWLRNATDRDLPGGSAIWKDYLAFQSDLPGILHERRLSHHELIFIDLSQVMAVWLDERARRFELRE